MSDVEINSKWRHKLSGEIVMVKSLVHRCVVYDMRSKEHYSDIVYFLNNFEPAGQFKSASEVC